MPVTTQTAWQCVIMMGDPKQLLPTHLSKNACEVSENALVSPLALAIGKDAEHIVLKQQYRMASSISEFPNQYFYDGMLIDTEISKMDNRTRQRARLVSQKYYGIKVNKDDMSKGGSEYWLIDVCRDVARVEDKGTSLQNLANADAIMKLVRNFRTEGIEVSDIGVLSFYGGQKRTITRVLAQDGTETLHISKVDSFQGQEIGVIIVDVVAANSNLADAAAEEAEEDGNAESEFASAFTRLTAHVANPNRICTAITRGQNSVIIVGQLRAMVGKVTKTTNSAIAELAANARERGLVYTDKETLDSHPAAIAERESRNWIQLRGTKKTSTYQCYHSFHARQGE